MSDNISQHCLYAWVGEDELGNGTVGIKQGIVPAGCIPLVTMDYDAHKISKLKPVMEAQAQRYGKKIRLVRFRYDEVITETESGS